MSEKLATVDIKGKDYVLVNERIKYFREHFKNFSLTTEILQIGDGVVVMRANIINPEGQTVATGHAYEKEGSSYINKTSYIENCETSAWGRALANFGIGVDTSVASYEEVANAVLQQKMQIDENKLRKGNVDFQMQFADPNGLVICPVCGEKVKSVKAGDKTWTPFEILDKYGMCYECGKKERKKHANSPETS